MRYVNISALASYDHRVGGNFVISFHFLLVGLQNERIGYVFLIKLVECDAARKQAVRKDGSLHERFFHKNFQLRNGTRTVKCLTRSGNFYFIRVIDRTFLHAFHGKDVKLSRLRNQCQSEPEFHFECDRARFFHVRGDHVESVISIQRRRVGLRRQKHRIIDRVGRDGNHETFSAFILEIIEYRNFDAVRSVRQSDIFRIQFRFRPA